jgi:predicted DNA-binding transcriptional regulator AlpA
MAAGRSRAVPLDLLTPREVARMLHISVKTLYRLVRAGTVPPPIRLSRQIARWRPEDIARFLRRTRGGPP